MKKQLNEGEKKIEEGVKRPKTPVEEFTNLCREKLKVTIREFDYSESECSEREKQRTAFQTQANSQSVTSFSLSFLYINYLHFYRESSNKLVKRVSEIFMKYTSISR